MSFLRKLTLCFCASSLIPLLLFACLEYSLLAKQRHLNALTELHQSASLQASRPDSVINTDQDATPLLIELLLRLAPACVLGILIAAAVARRFYHPVKQLTQLARQVADGDVSQRLTSNGKDELAELTNTINQVLDQIALNNQTLEMEVRKRTHELNEARLMAEEKSEVQSEFLANMSHEIRTPLNGILGISTLLSKSKLDSRQLEYLQIIQRSGQSLLVILNDILDLSKMRAGKLSISPTPFNLAELISDAIQELQPAVADKNLRLDTELAPDLPTWVRTDPTRLKQILLNLLGNAIKFTEQGSVTLKAHNHPLASDRSELNFCIQDTGIGIASKNQATIFDAFTQADGGTTRRFGGTGLGLTIVAKLVELMNGRIWLKSRIGMGSEFFVALPVEVHNETLQDATLVAMERREPIPHRNAVTQVSSTCSRFQETAAAPPDEDDFATVPLSILVAEDNKTNQRLIHDLLSARGHKLTIVDNGLAAVRAYCNGHFDQILMDVQMPVMDGLEATQKIRELEEKNGHPIPIIALTAHALRGDDRRCYAAGMDHYLAKPLDPALLIHKIEGHHGHDQSLNRRLDTPANEDNGSALMLLDKTRLNEITRNNQSLMRSIVTLFLDELPDMRQEIETAQQSADGNRLSQAVHRLKSALGNFCTVEYYREIAALEVLAMSAAMEDWRPSWHTAEQNLEQLVNELKAAAEL